MSEAKFTKGPWEALTNGNAYNFETVVTFKNAADGWICTVYDDCDDCTLPDGANAHLIAAAPELYDMLYALMGGDEKMQVAIGGNPSYVDGFMSRANSVLAKARGE